MFPGQFQSSGDFENPQWELFTNGHYVTSMAWSNNGSIMWVGTHQGLEKRDGVTYELLDVYTHLDGLSDIQVSALASDGDGVWVGTYNGGFGRMSADGVWQAWLDSGPLVTHVNPVVSLIPDGSGGLWVGFFENCLVHLMEDGSWQVYTPENSGLPDNHIISLALDGFGGLWTSSHDELAHLKANGSWVVFGKDNSPLPGRPIWSLASDGSGGVWAATENGLFHLTCMGLWQEYTPENSGLPYKAVGNVCPDGAGGAWLSTFNDDAWEGGLAHVLADGSFEVLNPDYSVLHGIRIRRIVQDGAGGIWIGTLGNGLWRFLSSGAWQAVEYGPERLPFFRAYDLVKDASGDLWAATAKGIGHLLPDKTWRMWDMSNTQLPTDYITSIAPTGSGGFWFGSYYGIVGRLSPDGSCMFYRPGNSGMLRDPIRFVTPDTEGGVWAGTHGYSGRLGHLMVNGNWQVFSGSDLGVGSAYFTDLIPDGSGGVWIGTSRGLIHRFSNGTRKVYSGWDEDANWITSILSDGSGGVWVGTYGGGLRHLNSNGHWETHNVISAFGLYNYIEEIAFDGFGGIWVGTNSSGLAHMLPGGDWQVFDKENSGLAVNEVEALVSDGAGGLWVATGDEDTAGLAHLTFGPQTPDTPSYSPGDPPETNRTVCGTGDRLLITLPAISSDKDAYVMLMPPDGSLYFFSDTNTLASYSAEECIPWVGGDTAADRVITEDFARGEYTAFLLQVPSGIDPVGNMHQWELGWTCFLVQ